jgi:uncharacterized RDD family membrane protein YckC
VKEALVHCSSCGAATADGAAFCGSCGRPIIGYSVAQSSAADANLAGAVVIAADQARTRLYAGFWLRFVAAIIDGLVLGIPAGVLIFLSIASVVPSLLQNAHNAQDPQQAMAIVAAILPRYFFLLILLAAGSWLYWALLESSEWQATLGKKALGLYVTDLDGKRTTFGKASGRFWSGRGIGFVPSIGGLYYLIDCIMAGFTEKKQALHDMIASCLVLRKV